MRNTFQLFCLMLFLSSCKYEDGPILSLNSAESRVAGSYYIETVTENGIDQMDKLNPLNIQSLNFNYPSDHGVTYDYWFSVSYTDTTAISQSLWNLTNNDSKLFVDRLSIYSSFPSEIPFAPLPGFLSDSVNSSDYLVWQILKLTDKKIWIKTTFHDKEYEVHLKEM